MPVLGSDPMFQEFRDAVDPSTAPPLVTAMVSLAHLLIPPAVSRRARVSVGVRVVRVPVRACALSVALPVLMLIVHVVGMP